MWYEAAVLFRPMGRRSWTYRYDLFILVGSHQSNGNITIIATNMKTQFPGAVRPLPPLSSPPFSLPPFSLPPFSLPVLPSINQLTFNWFQLIPNHSRLPINSFNQFVFFLSFLNWWLDGSLILGRYCFLRFLFHSFVDSWDSLQHNRDYPDFISIVKETWRFPRIIFKFSSAWSLNFKRFELIFPPIDRIVSGDFFLVVFVCELGGRFSWHASRFFLSRWKILTDSFQWWNIIPVRLKRIKIVGGAKHLGNGRGTIAATITELHIDFSYFLSVTFLIWLF